MMKRYLAAAAILPAMFAAPQLASAADLVNYGVVEAPQMQDRDGVKIGYLDCRVGGGAGYVLGSAKELDCVFQSTIGSRATEHYVGTIRKVGIDVGFTTEGRLIWAVFAPTAGYHQGSLAGLYSGATVEATAGVGVGANVLVGGTEGSVHLQTISATGQIGLNAAATGTSVTLSAVN
jgi:hypothetical protein